MVQDAKCQRRFLPAQGHSGAQAHPVLLPPTEGEIYPCARAPALAGAIIPESVIKCARVVYPLSEESPSWLQLGQLITLSAKGHAEGGGAMSLTSEQQQTIMDAINTKSKGDEFRCPISGDTVWRLEDHLGMLPASGDPTEGWAGRTFPNAVLTCPTCGYTLTFNLYYLGVAEKLGLPQLLPSSHEPEGVNAG